MSEGARLYPNEAMPGKGSAASPWKHPTPETIARPVVLDAGSGSPVGAWVSWQDSIPHVMNGEPQTDESQRFPSPLGGWVLPNRTNRHRFSATSIRYIAESVRTNNAESTAASDAMIFPGSTFSARILKSRPGWITKVLPSRFER